MAEQLNLTSLFPLGGLQSEIWRVIFGNREGDTGKEGGSFWEKGRVTLSNKEGSGAYFYQRNLNLCTFKYKFEI